MWCMLCTAVAFLLGCERHCKRYACVMIHVLAGRIGALAGLAAFPPTPPAASLPTQLWSSRRPCHPTALMPTAGVIAAA
jgi:hypothetical protein